MGEYTSAQGLRRRSYCVFIPLRLRLGLVLELVPRCFIRIGVFSICVNCGRFISKSTTGFDYTRLEPYTYWAEEDANNNKLVLLLLLLTLEGSQASSGRDRPLCRQHHLSNMFYVTDPEPNPKP